MRVLIFSQYFWPETFRITEVALALRDAGCEVCVLTGQPNYPEGKVFDGYSASMVVTQEFKGLSVFRVPIVPRGHASAARLIMNYLSFIVSAGIFGSWILRGRPIDAILVFAPSPILQAIPAIWLARLKGATLLTWVQDLWPESLSATGFVKSEALLRLVGGVVRWIYRRNDCLLVQSEAFLDSVRRMSDGTPVCYHPNPGDFPLCSVVSADSPVEFDAGFNVLFAGNLGTVQALETIVQVASLLRAETDISFVLVGSGSRLGWLQGEINRLGLVNLKVAGRFPPTAMPAIMSRASALLVSLVRSPIMAMTVPSKVQAYLAAGRPIIAALDGEGARIVNEAGAGLTCPAEDAEALAAVVKKLRDMPVQQREQMGANAHKYYQENYEPGMLANKLLQLISDTPRRRR